MLFKYPKYLALGFDVNLIQDSLDLSIDTATIGRILGLVCHMNCLENLGQCDGLGGAGKAIAAVASFARLDDIGMDQVGQHPPHKDSVGFEAERHGAAGAQAISLGQDYQCLNRYGEPPRTVEISHSPLFSPSASWYRISA